jgi:hypothetical protein
MYTHNRISLRSRIGIAILFGTLMVPGAHSSAERANEIPAQVSAIASAQTLRAVVYDFRSVLLRGTSEAIPLAAERLADLSDVRVGLAVPADSRLPPAGEAAGPVAEETGAVRADRVTVLDHALMILFTAGLVAYQLSRKQRLLQYTTLAEGSI